MTPRGEVDLATADALEAQLDTGAPTVLDLSHVTFMDSTGLRTLVSVHNEFAEAGDEFRVIVPDGPVHRIIEITGLFDALKVSRSLDEATG